MAIGTLLFLLVALAIALGFEAINGFHDTANAVATVIYTKSLRPQVAVILSGVMNFLGVAVGGIAVAFSIVHLLPVDMLVKIDSGAGMAMVLSLLIAAMIWNFGTWYMGIPSSSSHTLIGAIIGVGLMSSWLAGNFGEGVNWKKAGEVGLSLLISPLIGFALAALLLVVFKFVVRSPAIHQPPVGDKPPPWWVRCILILTCTGVSFAHGSNDGQKGIGLIMLILIGLVPASYAMDAAQTPEEFRKLHAHAGKIREVINDPEVVKGLAATRPERPVQLAFASETPKFSVADVPPHFGLDDPDLDAVNEQVVGLQGDLEGKEKPDDLDSKERWRVRTRILLIDQALHKMDDRLSKVLVAERAQMLQSLKESRGVLRSSIEYAPFWVIGAVALALGLGTMVGWKRIVVTVGEKIGKTHLTYSQGASAELVAMTTIGMADVLGMPVSTTHVLSSGVAGTMAANQSGLQMSTIRSILLAWVLTLPVSVLLAALLYMLFQQVM
jgi:PiT family inorganic phosphate transporter